MTNSVLDPEVLNGLREMADGDDAFLNDLFATYFEQAVETLKLLRSTAAAANRIGFGRAAHALKGSSLNIGASSVVALCQRIEADMERPGAVPSSDDVVAIEREIARVEREVRAVQG